MITFGLGWTPELPRMSAGSAVIGHTARPSAVWDLPGKFRIKVGFGGGEMGYPNWNR